MAERGGFDGMKSPVQNKLNNIQGKFFERMIILGCQKYAMNQEACIEKTPEDFHPQKIDKKSKKVSGYYKEKAQPDFKGTLKGGRAICFEAKMTMKDRINKSVITENQATCLSNHAMLGAYCGVCVMINKTVGFVPWGIWRNMEDHYEKKSLSESELKEFEVPTPMYVDFLANYRKGNSDEKNTL